MGKFVHAKQHRGHHEGHYRQRKDGLWECQFTLPNGKVKSVYGKTRPTVRAKMEDALDKARKGIDPKGERQTLTQFLTVWLAETQRPKLRPSTIKSYESYIGNHIVPALGDTMLRDLTRPGRAAVSQWVYAQTQAAQGQDDQRRHSRLGQALASRCAVHTRHSPRRTGSGTALGLRRAQRGIPHLPTAPGTETSPGTDRRASAVPHRGHDRRPARPAVRRRALHGHAPGGAAWAALARRGPRRRHRPRAPSCAEVRRRMALRRTQECQRPPHPAAARAGPRRAAAAEATGARDAPARGRRLDGVRARIPVGGRHTAGREQRHPPPTAPTQSRRVCPV